MGKGILPSIQMRYNRNKLKKDVSVLKNQYSSYIIDQFQKLSSLYSPSGFTGQAIAYVQQEFSRLGYSAEKTRKGGLLVDLGGEESQDAVLLSAHVDTLGGMVCSIKENGRLRISPIGGLTPDNVEAENCTIFTRFRGTYSGTFQLNNASLHVNREYQNQKRTFENMEVVVDEKTFSKQETEALGIAPGDYVCFDPRTVVTASGYIKSRFIDDKMSVAVLLGYAKHLKEDGVSLKRRVYLHITVYEEVGHGAAGSVPQGVTEMLVVDMGCVGDGLGCNEQTVSICAKDSKGPSNYEMVTRLVKKAQEYGLQYAVDVYPFYGSDADAAVQAGNDLRHCLIGAGVYASHGYERTHVEGVANTFSLLCAYLEEESE